MRNFLKYIILIFTFLLCSISIYSQSSGRIYHIEKPEADTIDFGMCLVGDSLRQIFVLDNNGTNVLTIGSLDPTYLMGEAPNHPFEFQEFDKAEATPFNIPVQSQRYLNIYYRANPNLVQYPIGRKEAIMKVGLYIDTVDKPTQNELVAFRQFYLIARKTNHNIDGFQKVISFDSVYVHPAEIIRKFWKVQNSSIFNLRVNNQKLIVKSKDSLLNEFISLTFPPIEFIGKFSQYDWGISYQPENIGGDTAELLLFFNPNPNNPTIFDTCSATIIGFGVIQKLNIDTFALIGDFKVSGDTIDIGEVWVNKSKKIRVPIKNEGNIPYGVSTQKLMNINNDDSSKSFSIRRKFMPDGSYLFPSETDNFEIEFFPDKRGNFIARYVIKSDIETRKIKGYPESALTKTYYIIGKGIEPEINLKVDSIDFGNVVIHQDCPTTRDTIIYLANNGNTTLNIYNIILDPPPPTPFRVNVGVNQIPPNSEIFVNIKFSTQGQPIDEEFKTTAIFVTNSTPPKDSLRIKLRAIGVKPSSTKLSIAKDIKSKPGRLISIPILVEKTRISRLAKSFEDTLVYNPNLLRFESEEIIGTASERKLYTKLEEFPQYGMLTISIKMPQNIYFGESDTLILLKFKTFLGDKISTPITFTNPQFGDYICSKVLSSDISNGVFSLDSICGLELKTVPINIGMFRFENLTPNPANTKVEFNYEIPYEDKVNIELYNYYGEKVAQVFENVLPAGSYKYTYYCENLPNGVYLCRFNSGIFYETKLLYIYR